jgi:hypothetical protein
LNEGFTVLFAMFLIVLLTPIYGLLKKKKTPCVVTALLRHTICKVHWFFYILENLSFGYFIYIHWTNIFPIL